MKAFDFYFRIETRSLALFRILLGAILIVDWKFRWENIPSFYVESGISPLSSDLPRGPGEWHFCILDSVRSLPMMHLVFLGGLAVYFCFLVGWRTRLMSVLALIFYCGLVSRILIISYAGDSAVKTLLLWACFLPLGACWSMDARRAGKPAPLRTEPTLAALLIVAQLGIIYFATAMSKSGQDWQDGNALYYSLHLGTLATPLGRYLGEVLPLELMRITSWMTLAFEWVFLFMILAPVGQPWLRRAALALSTAFLVAIWLTLDVGLFPPIMIAANALLLMPRDWAVIEKLAAKWGIKGLRSHFTTAAVPMAPKSVLWPREGFLILLAAANIWNCYNNHVAERFHLLRVDPPWVLRGLVLIPLIGQSWKMFTPSPYHYDGWYVFEGTTEDGSSVDPWNHGQVSYEKPDNMSWQRGSSWRKVYERMCKPKYSRDAYYWTAHVVREYNCDRPTGKRIKSVRLIYVEETIPPPGSGETPKVTNRTLGEWSLEALAAAAH